MPQGQENTADIDVEAWRARIRLDVTTHYHYRMGEAIERLEKNHAAAIVHLKTCLNHAPGHVQALGELIRILEAAGADAEASAWRDVAEQRVPEFESALALALGEDACASGDFEAAMEQARTARRLGADAASCASLEGEILLRRGTIASGLGKPDEAMELSRAAANLCPAWVPPRRLLACLLEQHGCAEEAMDVWRSIAEIDPDHGEANLKVGYNLHHNGRLEESLPYLERTVASRPNDDFAMLHLGLGLLLTDRPVQAMAVLRRCIEANRNASEAYELLGAVQLALGDAQGCLAVCAEADGCFGPSPSRNVVLALGLLALGRTVEAGVKAAEAGDGAMAVFVRALLVLDDRQPEAVLEGWGRMAEEFAIPYFRLVVAGLLAELGRVAEAEADLAATLRFPGARFALRVLSQVHRIGRRLDSLSPPGAPC